MAKTKVHINVSAGLSGVTIQRCEGHNSYVVTPWDELTTEEQQQITKLFEDIYIIYSHNLETSDVTKRCSKCGRLLPLNMFYKRINSKGINKGVSMCKECRITDAKARNVIYRKKRTPEDIEAEKEYNKNYYESHKKPKEEKQCKNCVFYKNCFTEEYANESNFANTCKKYKLCIK